MEAIGETSPTSNQKKVMGNLSKQTESATTAGRNKEGVGAVTSLGGVTSMIKATTGALKEMIAGSASEGHER